MRGDVYLKKLRAASFELQEKVEDVDDKLDYAMEFIKIMATCKQQETRNHKPETLLKYNVFASSTYP
jgi:hypothetical protein